MPSMLLCIMQTRAQESQLPDSVDWGYPDVCGIVYLRFCLDEHYELRDMGRLLTLLVTNCGTDTYTQSRWGLADLLLLLAVAVKHSCK